MLTTLNFDFYFCIKSVRKTVRSNIYGVVCQYSKMHLSLAAGLLVKTEILMEA